MFEWLFSLFMSYAEDHPSWGGMIVAMGLLRVIFKPAMSLLEAYVLESKSTTDDEWLAKIKANQIYKSVVWLVDYLMSVKLPR